MQHIKQFILFPRFDIYAILFAVGIKTEQPTPFQESVAGELAGARMSHEVRHHRPNTAAAFLRNGKSLMKILQPISILSIIC